MKFQWQPALLCLLLGFVFTSAAADECSNYQDQCDNTLRERLRICEHDYSEEKARGYCKRTAVRAWGICWQQSDFQCDDEAPQGGGGNQMDDGEPCPPGQTRNPLGLCTAYFKQAEPPPGIAGCPAGEEPGPDDRCVPSIRVKAVPHSDGYYVACPKGMKPSPIDGGCVIDDSNWTEEDDCPGGGQPGPDDGPCDPIINGPLMEEELNNVLHTLQLIRKYQRDMLPVENVNELNDRVMNTPFPELTHDSVMNELDAMPVDYQ